MSLTDILIFIGILLFVALGIKDGFFKKLYGIIGFLGGLIAATKLMSPLADILIDWFDFTRETSMILGFAIVFLFSIVVVNLLYRWFGHSGSESIKFWSRITGGIIGAFQGMVAVSLILVMLDLFQIPGEETKNDSVLYEDTYQLAPTIFDYSTRWMPDSKMFFEEIKDVIESVKTR
ncbi:MAG: CvpA family protein [Ignavibacteriales bacterium]|nr:CvpA family protein [Ignavibacteriales bacterium]